MLTLLKTKFYFVTMQKGFKIFGLYFRVVVIVKPFCIVINQHLVFNDVHNTRTHLVCYIQNHWMVLDMQCNLPESYFLSLIHHFTHLIFFKSKMNNHLFLYCLLILTTHFFICYNNRERTSNHLVMLLLYILFENAVFDTNSSIR